jgi:hypothetical protein
MVTKLAGNYYCNVKYIGNIYIFFDVLAVVDIGLLYKSTLKKGERG